jgi:CRP-like cAMP-binding protein
VERAKDGPEALRLGGLTASDMNLVLRQPLFAGLPGEDVARLLEGASVRRCRRGHVLFIQGEPAPCFYLVLEGWVRLFRQLPDGQAITIALFGKGESFAEAIVFQMMPYPVSAEAVSEARLLAIPADGFLRQLRASTDLCLKVMASMSRRLNQLVQQVEQIASRSTVERLALFLLRLCRAESGPCRVELPLDKTLIAARLAMQPETLSRCLAKLRRVGVTTEGHSIVIADVARLRQLATAGMPMRR